MDSPPLDKARRRAVYAANIRESFPSEFLSWSVILRRKR